MSTTPSCLSFPFPWFGERGREKGGSGGQQQQEEERFRERLRSVSSSSLPYLTTSGRGEQVRGELETDTPSQPQIVLVTSMEVNLSIYIDLPSPF